MQVGRLGLFCRLLADGKIAVQDGSRFHFELLGADVTDEQGVFADTYLAVGGHVAV